MKMTNADIASRGLVRTGKCPNCAALLMEADRVDWTKEPEWPSRLPPTALRMVERVMAFGAEKYGGNDAYLTDGRPPGRHADAAERKLSLYLSGALQDHKSGEHPLAHSIVRLMMALELELRGEGSES